MQVGPSRLPTASDVPASRAPHARRRGQPRGIPLGQQQRSRYIAVPVDPRVTPSGQAPPATSQTSTMLNQDQLEALKPGLFAGHYNLLLGSGTSLDSFDASGKGIVGASALTELLCQLKNAKSGTSLARVSGLLTEEETHRNLTLRYSCCKPGETVSRISGFVWKSIFTFNIDDALEAAYEKNPRAKQTIQTVNYDAAYDTSKNISEVNIIHLHGYAREGQAGYVFSISEYARVTRNQNPWMHVLSEVLASEPFIISGTSLNESDLEYYLSGRTSTSPRKNRGPSLLVEPYPDAATEHDCSRHGLILVKGTLGEFLAWLVERLGNPPVVSQLVLPPMGSIFRPLPAPAQQIQFFSTFALVQPVQSNDPSLLSPFYYGQPPRWSDLESATDLPTAHESQIGSRARHFFDSSPTNSEVLCLSADPGTGKTTSLRRVAYDLSKEGRVLFFLSTRIAIDADLVASCLALMVVPFALVLDNVADHASALSLILADARIRQPFLVLCADRSYRHDHIDRILGDFQIEYLSISPWDKGSLIQLIERYRVSGLIGSPDALRLPAKFAQDLSGGAIAIAVCRILNNFRPLDVIVKSIWNHSSEQERRSYLIAAIAEHCHWTGIYYPILEKAQPNPGLRDQLSFDTPLPLAFSGDDDDYVLPLQPAIADRALVVISRDKGTILLEAFTKLSMALAPYVNRRTVIEQTPEARLAGRLFNAERVVRPLLKEHSAEFFHLSRESWQWNSRYWEQRALLTQTSDIDTAVQYGRHAVAIEAHPFPWTTLASLLIRKLNSAPQQRDALFEEILDILTKVFKFEDGRNWRSTPHPYSAL